MATVNEGPRAYTISPDDHRGVVMCVSVLFIGYALMIIGMRLSARLRTMGIDDYIAVVATVFSVIQFAVVMSAVSYHFGTSYKLGYKIGPIAKLIRASDVLLLISLFTAKCAAIWLCRRLFTINHKAPRIFCDLALGGSALWCIGSILAITIGCNDQAAVGRGSCPQLLNRWIGIGVIDAILELAIFGLAAYVVWPLNLTVSRRLSAISCFFFRLVVIVFIALHLHYLSGSLQDSNRGVATTKPIIFRQAQLLFSLFSAAVPALNQYLRRFQTSTAVTFGFSPGTYAGNAYGLKSLQTGRHESTYTATVCKDVREASADDGRQNSEDWIIRKDVDYQVSYADIAQEVARYN